MQNKYDFINENICLYLINEIISKKRQWCKIWIDQKMHFNNHTFFKSEEKHAQLKTKLKSCIEDFMSVIKKTDRRCERIKRKYINKLDDDKQRLNHKFKKSLFRNLMFFVIFHALRAIDEHYVRLFETQNTEVDLSSCTKIFRRTMNFSCAHEIEKRFVDAVDENVLKLIDVHFHWRYQKFVRHYSEPDAKFVKLSNDESLFSDSLFQIQNSRKVKIKKRSTEIFNKNRKKRDRQAERQRRFTQRDFSTFEYATIIDLTSKMQMSFNQFSSDHYIVMFSFSSQFYNRSVTQYIDEFTKNTMTSTIDHKRRNNNNITINIKRAKKTN